MADFNDLLKELNVSETGSEQAVENRRGRRGTSGNVRTGTGRMSGAFRAGGVRRRRRASGRNRRRRRPVSWSIGSVLRDLPYAYIICTAVSILMGLYVIRNFDQVTWTLFSFIYQLISAGFVILVILVIILLLILVLRRRRRW